jgi:hypothetical protein
MKPTFTIDYNLTLDGEPKELLEKLNLWIENKFYDGRVDIDSFIIKERGKGLYEKMTDPTHIDLATTIEGQIENNKKIKLSAELNSGPKIQAYLIRVFIIFFGLIIAIGSFDWVYSTLTLCITTGVYLFNNHLIRKRVKKDLDGFIWRINNKTSTQLK